MSADLPVSADPPASAARVSAAAAQRSVPPAHTTDSAAQDGVARLRLRVEGIVQGVGFRPFIHALAAEHGLSGFVGNDSAGVFAEAEGDPASLSVFLTALQRRAPPLAVIDAITVERAQPTGEHGFVIVASDRGSERTALIAPDTATCADCLREISDPAARRYRYAFTNCTNCGPRFSIVTGVPYDRHSTTMAEFAMCADCAAEYHDPADRRFHAQPVCCPACGPVLRLLFPDATPVTGDPVETAARWLAAGRVLAVKGLGGYHLAALAEHEGAVGALRARKHREDKPFAIMVASLAQARALAHLDPVAERLLSSASRPIVLLPRRADARVAAAVAPGNRDLGLMLPYTPLHHLLAERLAQPFVLTSGNVSDEPIAYRDDDARQRLSGIADGFLLHNRRIHIRTDDSVTRVFSGRQLLLRRSRGYAPAPVPLRWPFPRPVLACGAHLKNTFCLGKGTRAFVSHHVGDLENAQTLRSFTEGIEHLCRLFDIRPEIVAHDLHPEYLPTKYAHQYSGGDLVAVQHHHAHIASCLADNGVSGPVIGVAFDGLGLGEDGTMWGGELLIADLAGFERAGHLETVPMPGGAAAVREPWRMAAAYLDALYGDDVPGLDVMRRHTDRWAAVTRLARTGISSPRTSSAGRLFDAVSAILGIRDTVTYEGQAAIELEQRVAPGEDGAYPSRQDGGSPLVIAGGDLVRYAVDDLLRGESTGSIAARFHNGLARAVVRAAETLRERTGLRTVALSGGVFQNLMLLGRLVPGLESAGFGVLMHSRVPPNDGGVSLGQAVVAAAREQRSAPPPA